MAIYEVTITGCGFSPCFDEDDEPSGYAFYEDSHVFHREGSDLITTMMAVQALLDRMNEGLKNKHPDVYKDGADWEYKIVGICKTDFIRFNEMWIKEFVEQGILSRNYEDQEN